MISSVGTPDQSIYVCRLKTIANTAKRLTDNKQIYVGDMYAIFHMFQKTNPWRRTWLFISIKAVYNHVQGIKYAFGKHLPS